MQIFRKFSSKKNAKGVIRESSGNDLQTPRKVEVRPCEWPHDAFLEEARIHQEFAQFVANAGLTEFLADKCDQYHILTNSFAQSFTYLGRNNPPEVQFNLYAGPHTLSLVDFCNICLIPSDGDLREPRPSEFEDFLLVLIVGEDRGVSSATATSLQFPSVHYFALVITKFNR